VTVAQSCLITSSVSGRCAECGRIDERMHVYENAAGEVVLYCADHCQLHRFGEPLSGEIKTVSGKQEAFW
jgi:hypothetical protein